MSTQVQFRRGTTAENDAFTGAVGEITVDTTLNKLRLHDGSTAGGSVIVGQLVLIQSQVVGSTVASVDFTTAIDATYDAYTFVISGFRPTNLNVSIVIRVGTPNFQSGSVYSYHGTLSNSASNNYVGLSSAADTFIRCGDFSNAATANGSLEVVMSKPADSALLTTFAWFGGGLRGGPTAHMAYGYGQHDVNAVVTKVKFFTNSGNIEAGRFTLFGVRHD